jgi:hypothetical protein
MKDQDLAKDQDSGKETSRSRSLNDSNWLNEKNKKDKKRIQCLVLLFSTFEKFIVQSLSCLTGKVKWPYPFPAP